jgi:hypothetical protein
MSFRTSREVNRVGWGVWSERLSSTCLGKTSRGKPRPKPESGNPTFRDCRGGPRKRDLVFVTKCARLGSIPTPATVEQTGWKRVLPFTG